MKGTVILCLCGLAIVTAACASYAGPFVSNISSDGRGGIVVEKCLARYDQFSATVGNSNCTTHNIKLGAEEDRAK